MPRLTNKQYLAHRAQLRTDWLDDNAWAFSCLELAEEKDLHAYFAPTNDFDDIQAIAHRGRVTKQHAELPQRAGRAYARARIFLGNRPAVKPLGRSSGRRSPVKGHVVVRTVLNPNPDIEKLARILMRMAEAQVDTERDAA